MARLRRYWWIVLILVLLAGGATVCALRWQAWFGMPDEPEWTGDTIAYRFHCFGDDSVPGFVAADGEWKDTLYSDTLDILLLGDVHSGLKHADYDTLATRLPHIDCYAQLGDWLERGYFYYEQQLYRELQGTRLDSIPVLTCPGNHEYQKNLHRSLSPVWEAMFRHPKNGPVGMKGANYYVDFPGLRFIVIDTQGLRLLRHFTRINEWLTRVIQGAGNRYIVVMMHHPVYSNTRGRANVGVYLSCLSPLRQADLVFSGHDHQYARQLPFVATTSCNTHHEPKFDHYHERQGVGDIYYERIMLYHDTLRMFTYRLATGELYDECVITH
ncbi:MAG: metallophosphoesterase [Paludibacteraceae bacterium]|nr:metallophosphoesterase [Paludibacteraceae bacterium]